MSGFDTSATEVSGKLDTSAREEWRRNWPIPFVGMIGLSATSMWTFSNGIFQVELIQEFGWSRTQYALGLTVLMLTGLFAMPVVGRLVDRFGPRRVALAAVPTFVIGFSLFGLVGPQPWQWWALSAAASIFVAGAAPVVWMTAVASRFQKSRGLALAIPLCGTSLAATIWPLAATLLIAAVGWRLAFGAMALTWAAVTMPLVYFLFHDDEKAEADQTTGDAMVIADYRDIILSRSFAGIALSGALFAFGQIATMANLVPILRESGIDAITGATIAGAAGLFGLVGRVLTGISLDRLPSRPIAFGIFILPIFGALFLLSAGDAPLIAIFGAACFGLAAGAELDIVTFLAVRFFGVDRFGVPYSITLGIIAVCASLGPVTAGMLRDASGTYSSLLIAIIPISAVAALATLLIPPSHPIHDDPNNL